jgi:hypothetical protein
MFGFLRCLGLGWLAAVTGGLVNMFGPLQTPADLHMLQYPPWCLPLTLWTLERYLQAPTASRRATLAAAITVSFFASYQIAANLTVLLALVAVQQMLRGKEGRSVAGTIALVLAVAVGALLAFSVPYLRRLTEPNYRMPLDWQAWNALSALGRGLVLREVRWSVLVLAIAGLASHRWLDRSVWHAITLGASAAVVGAVLAAGWSAQAGGITFPLPFTLIALTPVGSVVSPWRFAVLAGTGLAMLSACACEAMVSPPRGRKPARIAMATAALLVVILETGRAFGSRPLTCLPVGEHVPAV